MIEEIVGKIPLSAVSSLITRGVKDVEIFMNNLLLCNMCIKFIPADGGFFYGIEESDVMVQVLVEYEDGTSALEWQPKFTEIAQVSYAKVADTDMHEKVFEQLTEKFKQFEIDLANRVKKIENEIENEKLAERQKQLSA